jgi:hypothetical protein
VSATLDANAVNGVSHAPTSDPNTVGYFPVAPDTAGILKFSPTVTKIAAALVSARSNVGKIIKGQTAKIEGERAKFAYDYADLADVLAAVQEPLSEAGLCPIQGVATNGTEVTVETMLLHSSGEFVKSALTMKSSQNTPQGLGSTITYCRRYALQAMLGVAPAKSEDDDGKAGSHGCGHDERAIAEEAVKRQRIAANIGALITKNIPEGLTRDGIIDLCKAITDGKVAEWTTLDSFGALQSFYAALKAWKPAAPATDSSTSSDVANQVEAVEIAAPAVEPSAERLELLGRVKIAAGFGPEPVTSVDAKAKLADAIAQTLGLAKKKLLKNYTEAELGAYLTRKALEAEKLAREATLADSDAPAAQERVLLPAETIAELEKLAGFFTEDDGQELAGQVSGANGVTYDYRLLTPAEALTFRERCESMAAV